MISIFIGLTDRQTDRHKSRSRQYIDRAKDWVEWTLEKPPRVKNRVLPRKEDYIRILITTILKYSPYFLTMQHLKHSKFDVQNTTVA